MKRKHCRTCKKFRLTKFFNNDINGELRSYCKFCANKRLRELRKMYPEKFRNRKLKERYGITQGMFEIKLMQQGGTCAICPSSENLVVDHDHRTKKFRGVLCQSCNKGLGCFKDNRERLSKAMEYLWK